MRARPNRRKDLSKQSDKNDNKHTSFHIYTLLNFIHVLFFGMKFTIITYSTILAIIFYKKDCINNLNDEIEKINMQFILCKSLLVKEREWIHSSRRITLNETTRTVYTSCYSWQVCLHYKKSLPVAILNTQLKNKQILSALNKKKKKKKELGKS